MFSVALITAVSQIGNLFENKAKRPDVALTDISGIRSQIQTIEARLTRVDDLVKGLSTPNPAASISIEQEKLGAQIAAMNGRLKSIESAILESPERALSIPLLRKDIAESAKRVEEYRIASRFETDRLYEQQKWMLGGIGTVLLAVIGGAITIIFRSLPNGRGDDAYPPLSARYSRPCRSHGRS